MFDGASGVLALASAIVAPIAAALLKRLLSQRKHRDVHVKFESGEQLHFMVDSQATVEEIHKLIQNDAGINQKAREMTASH